MRIVSSRNRKGNRRIYAEEEVEVQEQGAVDVDPEATELVFETQDVAELIAEVTGNDVEVVADENEVTFTVGDTDFTVEAEGGEEVLEASTAIRRRNAVRANTRNSAQNRRNVSASRSVPARRPAGRTVRRVSK